MHTYIKGIVLLVLIGVTHAFPSGAPSNICGRYVPGGHRNRNTPVGSPRTGPFALDVQPSTGGSYKVTLRGTQGNSFKGFVIQAMRANPSWKMYPEGAEDIVGQFQSNQANSFMPQPSQLRLCPGMGRANVITHSNSEPKFNTEFIWTPPPMAADPNYKLVATVVQDFDTFYVVQSDTINTQGGSSQGTAGSSLNTNLPSQPGDNTVLAPTGTPTGSPFPQGSAMLPGIGSSISSQTGMTGFTGATTLTDSSTNLGFPQGSTNLGFPQDSTNLGFPQGSTNLGFPQDSTNLGFPQGSTNLGFPQGSTNLGFTQGSTNLGFPQGSTNLGFPQGSVLFSSQSSETMSQNGMNGFAGANNFNRTQNNISLSNNSISFPTRRLGKSSLTKAIAFLNNPPVPTESVSSSAKISVNNSQFQLSVGNTLKENRMNPMPSHTSIIVSEQGAARGSRAASGQANANTFSDFSANLPIASELVEASTRAPERLPSFDAASTISPFLPPSTIQPFDTSSTVDPFLSPSTVQPSSIKVEPFQPPTAVQPFQPPSGNQSQPSNTGLSFQPPGSARNLDPTSTMDPLWPPSTLQFFDASSTVDPFQLPSTVQPFQPPSTESPFLPPVPFQPPSAIKPFQPPDPFSIVQPSNIVQPLSTPDVVKPILPPNINISFTPPNIFKPNQPPNVDISVTTLDKIKPAQPPNINISFTPDTVMPVRLSDTEASVTTLEKNISFTPDTVMPVRLSDSEVSVTTLEKNISFTPDIVIPVRLSDTDVSVTTLQKNISFTPDIVMPVRLSDTEVSVTTLERNISFTPPDTIKPLQPPNIDSSFTTLDIDKPFQPPNINISFTSDTVKPAQPPNTEIAFTSFDIVKPVQPPSINISFTSDTVRPAQPPNTEMAFTSLDIVKPDQPPDINISWTSSVKPVQPPNVEIAFTPPDIVNPFIPLSQPKPIGFSTSLEPSKPLITVQPFQPPPNIEPIQPPTTPDPLPATTYDPLAPPPPIFGPEIGVSFNSEANRASVTDSVTVPVTRPVASIDLPIRIDSPTPNTLPTGDVRVVVKSAPPSPFELMEAILSGQPPSSTFQVVSTPLSDVISSTTDTSSSVQVERPTLQVEPVVNIINIPVEPSGQIAAVLNLTRSDGTSTPIRLPPLVPGRGRFVTVGRPIGPSMPGIGQFGGQGQFGRRNTFPLSPFQRAMGRPGMMPGQRFGQGQFGGQSAAGQFGGGSFSGAGMAGQGQFGGAQGQGQSGTAGGQTTGSFGFQQFSNPSPFRFVGQSSRFGTQGAARGQPGGFSGQGPSFIGQGAVRQFRFGPQGGQVSMFRFPPQTGQFTSFRFGSQAGQFGQPSFASARSDPTQGQGQSQGQIGQGFTTQTFAGTSGSDAFLTPVGM